MLLVVASCSFSVGAYIQPHAFDSLKWCIGVNLCKVTALPFYTISGLNFLTHIEIIVLYYFQANNDNFKKYLYRYC